MQNLPLRQRALGAYLGLAVGDALGATVEFMTPNEIRAQYGEHRDIIGGGWLRLKPGQVTDDTQMSLALGESILANKGVDPEKVAQSFSDWLRTKPIDVGHTVRRGIVRFRATGQCQVPINEHDAGNGACMRSLPVALYHHRDITARMIHASRLQSRTTHHNQVSDAGTETVLQMIVAALHNAPRSDLESLALDLVKRQPLFRFDQGSMGNPGGWIVETLKAVFQAFFARNGFEDVLIDVVNRGGDADTTGAIAGMLAGAFYGMNAIPQRWLNALNADVRRACESQAVALIGEAN